MLPSTKLFKSINCPFHETDSDSCNRPYCHFNHTKPLENQPNSLASANPSNIQTLQPPVPVYIPTPKHILEARKANGSNANDAEGSASKKPKLEYVPKSISITSSPVPTYIPSSLKESSNHEYEPTNNFTKINAIAENIEGDSNGDDISGLLTELSNEQITNNDITNATKEIVEKKDIDKSKELKESKDSKSKENTYRSSSSSSSSRHRHHSSSHRSTHSDRKNSSSSRSGSSSHKSSHHSSGKSKHSDKDILKESRHSSKSSKNSKHRSGESRSKSSSSSSSSHHHSSRHSDKKTTHRSNKTSINKQKDCINSVVYETNSEDDDVEAQCRMIFDEFDPSTINSISDEMENGFASKTVENESNDILSKIDDATKKKRIAHENADKTEKIPVKKHTNHVKNAMQSVFLRQAIVRKQQEEKVEQERKEVEKRELLKSLESDKPEPKAVAPKQNLTPLIPPAALIAPRFNPKTFAPVTNMLAIEKAKQKVAELRAQKLAHHQQFASMPKTLAQSAVKGTNRVAHTNAAAQNTNANAKTNANTTPAPPVLEPSSTKISYNIRTQYYNLMVKHCLTIYDNCNDAWERAQTEEISVFKKCNTPVIYKSSALLAINKLRKESLDAGNINDKNKVISHDVILAGKHGQNTSWNLNRKPSTDGSTNLVDTTDSSKAYEMIAELHMTDDQLKENGYPRSGSKPGVAIIYKNHRVTPVPVNTEERYCRRCGKAFKLDEFDDECIDRCNYHPKSPGFRRGFADNSHRCCQQPAGSPGCMYANYHVTDYLDPNNLTGFIKTIACDDDYVPTRKDVFALDCEMCYTTVGLELTRVTVVDINRKTVYDALVKPDNRIIDYNTTYSGISEKTLEKTTRTLRDVQAVLLSMFNSKSVLIGHSLESDFKALKLIHDLVVDTSILFPHKMGPPKKRALKTLCIENLKRIIQEDDGGHNSAEDAEVCIDLVKYYLRNRIK